MGHIQQRNSCVCLTSCTNVFPDSGLLVCFLSVKQRICFSLYALYGNVTNSCMMSGYPAHGQNTLVIVNEFGAAYKEPVILSAVSWGHPHLLLTKYWATDQYFITAYWSGSIPASVLCLFVCQPSIAPPPENSWTVRIGESPSAFRWCAAGAFCDDIDTRRAHFEMRCWLVIEVMLSF